MMNISSEKLAITAAIGALGVAVYEKFFESKTEKQVREVSCKIVHQFGKEAKFLSRKTERAAAFDEAGEILLVKSGRKGRITYPPEEVDKLRDAEIYVHNHSIQGNSFSGSDISMMINLNIKKMLAVGREYTYIMKKTADTVMNEDERRQLANKIDTEFMNYFNKEVEKAREKARQMITQGIPENELAKFDKEVNMKISHDFWIKQGKGLLDEADLRYKRIKTKQHLWR